MNQQENIDPNIAASLGFPKLRYVFVEHERRWLCPSLPSDLVKESERITDMYVIGSNLRLREARSLSGRPPMLRLTRKVDVDEQTRLISSVYLYESEFKLLRDALAGQDIRTVRHRLNGEDGLVLAVDEFEGELAGLMLLEAEFPSAQESRAFVAPSFAGTEVTHDRRYTGGQLAAEGLPTAS